MFATPFRPISRLDCSVPCLFAYANAIAMAIPGLPQPIKALAKQHLLAVLRAALGG